jgi:hypothetical protein
VAPIRTLTIIFTTRQGSLSYQPLLFAHHFFYHPYLMQALRLARPRAPLRRSLIVRGLATTANPSLAASSTPSSSSVSATASTQQSIIPLSNVEAQWQRMSKEDKIIVHSQLKALQKKDWKTLSLDEKKACGFSCFFFCQGFSRYVFSVVNAHELPFGCWGGQLTI